MNPFRHVLNLISLLSAPFFFLFVAGQAQDFNVTVLIEEEVYSYQPAGNGAGPLWCHGSTCLARLGGETFATGLETIDGAKPLNNCRWTLYRRNESGWSRVYTNPKRTREPSPLGVLEDGRLIVSANPSVTADPGAYSGPARPELAIFRPGENNWTPRIVRPDWQGEPEFTEHSYRSLATDSRSGECVLFQNIGYTHAEWAFRDGEGEWIAQGELRWPIGEDYAEAKPIRICYPNVAMRNREVHFCGVSDIIEPNPEWRAYKKSVTGKEWDYDFRRLFYCWNPDVAKEEFRPWVEIASREETAGWITPGDLWAAPDGKVHVLWTERAIDERLREKFFPEARQSYALNYAILEQGKVVFRTHVLRIEEGEPGMRPGRGRFHVAPNGELYVVCYAQGDGGSENRIYRIRGNGVAGDPARVPFERPFTNFFTATPRSGSPISNELELLGERQGMPNRICYARVILR